MKHLERIRSIIDQSTEVFEYEKFYETDLDSLWEAWTDTDHIGRLMGMESVEVVERPLRKGVSERTVHWPSVGQSFIEEPYFWEYGKWYANLRKDGQGPLKSFAQYVTFTPENSGYRVKLRFGFDVRMSFKGIIFRLGKYSRHTQNENIFNRIDFTNTDPIPLHQSFPANEKRLQQLRTVLEENHESELVELLLEHIQTGLDIDVSYISPYQLAEKWGRYPERISQYREKVLEMLLDATRHGYMLLQWGLICPSCRGSKGQVDKLSKLKLESHCESCNIGFGARFSESVQVTFRPTNALRQLEVGMVCVAGPRRTPHQIISQVVSPAEKIPLNEKLIFDRPNRLVLRSFDGEHLKEIHEVGRYRITEEGIKVEESNAFVVENDLPRATKVVVQEEKLPSWVLTAGELIRRQSFLDHFSFEVLDPALQAEVGTITLMFSDLVGSTKLYREKGDADAFAVVNDHFRILKEVLNEHQGTLVKTVGDAIMAVFEHPEKAVACGIAMQRKMGEESDLGLRLGLHMGPCLAVTINERLDYFGGTVNQAARMEGQSKPGEMVLSEVLYKDAEVAEWLRVNQIVAKADQVTVKGIDVPLPIFRINCLA